MSTSRLTAPPNRSTFERRALTPSTLEQDARPALTPTLAGPCREHARARPSAPPAAQDLRVRPDAARHAPATGPSIEVVERAPDARPDRARVSRSSTTTARASCFYAPVDLDDPAILMQGGLDPSESDPRFHQQMVYAVAMKVIENFERALGRRVHGSAGRAAAALPARVPGRERLLRPATHAVAALRLLPADADEPRREPAGPDRLHLPVARHHRPRDDARDRATGCASTSSSRPTATCSPSTRASPTSSRSSSTSRFPTSCATRSRRPRGDLRSPDGCSSSPSSSGTRRARAGAAHRRRAGTASPTRSLLRRASSSRTSAARSSSPPSSTPSSRPTSSASATSSGSRPAARDPARGRPPPRPRQPDRRARRPTAAQDVLTMCIRAFEYLPPVDITFGDYLRALVTADFELVAEHGAARATAAMIEAFRLRGIYPHGVASLAEESLRLAALRPGDIEAMPAAALAIAHADRRADLPPRRPSAGPRPGRGRGRRRGARARTPGRCANAAALDLDPKRKIAGRRASTRSSASRPTASCSSRSSRSSIQTRPSTEGDSSSAGCRCCGGTTVVASADGDGPLRHLEAARSAEAQRREPGARRRCAGNAARITSSAAIATTRRRARPTTSTTRGGCGCGRTSGSLHQGLSRMS